MECDVGVFVNENCHKYHYGPVTKDIKLLSELNKDDQNLITLRTSSTVKNICKYHEIKFLLKYHHLFGKSCSDPLKMHKKIITKGLKEIKIQYLLNEKNYSVDLIPGKSLCSTCYSKLFVQKEECVNNNLESLSKNIDILESGEDNVFVPQTEYIDILDATCSNLGVSPVSKIKKLNSEKRQRAVQAKFEKMSNSIKRKLEASFEGDVNQLPEESLAKDCSSNFAEEYESLIKKLKEKCKTADKEEKVKILSLLPDSWSRKEISEKFQVSERLVKITRDLTKTYGILPDLWKKYSGKQIDEETVMKVLDFYTSEENSRILPGKKDCVSVRIDGFKGYKQKQLLLCNLNELYVKFKEVHPESKIGHSKFCALRPKWCVIAGTSGTHSVCVCSYHQNIKLMIDGAKLHVEYKDLLLMLVCDLNNPDCMLNQCTNCPDEQNLLDLLLQEDSEVIPDNVSYKQWVTTDRAEMISVIKPKEEFVECLVEKLKVLKKHHYVSKVQSKFLKDKKENLLDSECIVLGDFSENFSFVIQDEIQSFHWVNKQATVHPFVYYYKNSLHNKLNTRCFCVISDHLTHDTTTVHTFQKYLIHDIKTIAPSVSKLIYFSDGASSQYKNKKNFINLCHHEKDFGLQAEWNFFATSHGKNACDGVGGTTKREVTKKSLQMTTVNQILSPEDMFNFCDKNLHGIKYVYVPSEEVEKNGNQLHNRFLKCLPVPETRSYHRYLPVNDRFIRCYHTSASNNFQEVKISKTLSFTLQEKDIVACVYDKQWYLGIIEEVSIEHSDFKIHFYEPPGPRSSFKLSRNDKTWVPSHHILRKITPMELTTVTGRTHNITSKLCEEISQLFVEHHI